MQQRRSAKERGMFAVRQGSRMSFSVHEPMASSRLPFFDLVAELFGAVTRAMFGWIVRLLLCMLVVVLVMEYSCLTDSLMDEQANDYDVTAYAELNVSSRTWTNVSLARDESNRIRPHLFLHEIEDTLGRLDELMSEWDAQQRFNGQDVSTFVSGHQDVSDVLSLPSEDSGPKTRVEIASPGGSGSGSPMLDEALNAHLEYAIEPKALVGLGPLKPMANEALNDHPADVTEPKALVGLGPLKPVSNEALNDHPADVTEPKALVGLGPLKPVSNEALNDHPADATEPKVLVGLGSLNPVSDGALDAQHVADPEPEPLNGLGSSMPRSVEAPNAHSLLNSFGSAKAGSDEVSPTPSTDIMETEPSSKVNTINTLSTVNAKDDREIMNALKGHLQGMQVLIEKLESPFVDEKQNSVKRRLQDFESLARPIAAFRRSQDKNMHRKRFRLRHSPRRSLRKMLKRLFAGGIPQGLCLAIPLASGVMYLCSMMPGHYRPPMNGPRNHAHVGDAGPPYVGTATLKVPPAWSIERNQYYNLRAWISDLVLWSSATDLEPHRLGPIAALQVSGSAKELVREIPPEQLANGVWDGQQQITGLMLLVRTLVQRYAPLEGEASTRAISDFLNFQRLQRESVDAFLVRFDVLRNRAHQRGGLGVNHSGLAWLLLRALNVSPDLVDRLLQPLGGQLPQNDAQLGQLMERVRRQGHLFEGGFRHNPHEQAGTGDAGRYHFFPTFTNPVNPTQAAYPNMPDTAYASADAGGCWGAEGVQDDIARMMGGENGMGSYAMSHDADHCRMCGTFFEDEEFSSATESDTGSVDEGAQAYATVLVDGQSRQDDDARGNVLLQEYLAARRRWRRWSGKPPRRYRRVGFRGRPQQRARLERGPYARTYAAFLPSNAFAGGGKSAGKGFKGKNRSGQNPRGKDGKVMRCAKCGSESHLWRKCPQVVGNASSSTTAAVMSSAPAALTLMTSPMIPPNVAQGIEAWQSGGSLAPLTGVAFHYIAGSSAASQTASELSGSPSRYGTAYDDDLARLESASQIGSERSRKSRRSAPSSTPTAYMRQFPDAEEPAPEDRLPSFSADQFDPRVETLVAGAPLPKHPPPGAPGPSEDNLQRQRAVLQLSSLLHTWWETEESPSSITSAFLKTDEGKPSATMYHLRTRLSGGRVGLLVDPGAHDNLVGSRSSECIAAQVGGTAQPLKMDRHLSVEGVGKQSQTASQAQRVPLHLKDVDGKFVQGSFTAPVIEDSDLPPLLGLRSLQRMSSILDIGARKLYLPGPGGCQVKCSPGTRVFDLEMSPSGHLILPVDHKSGLEEQGNASDRLDFPMVCRRGQQPLSVVKHKPSEM